MLRIFVMDGCLRLRLVFDEFFTDELRSNGGKLLGSICFAVTWHR